MRITPLPTKHEWQSGSFRKPSRKAAHRQTRDDQYHYPARAAINGYPSHAPLIVRKPPVPQCSSQAQGVWRMTTNQVARARSSWARVQMPPRPAGRTRSAHESSSTALFRKGLAHGRKLSTTISITGTPSKCRRTTCSFFPGILSLSNSRHFCSSSFFDQMKKGEIIRYLVRNY